MESILISPEELGLLSDVTPIYGITDIALIQVYKFYRSHPQNAYYKLDMSKGVNLLDYYDSSSWSTYARYGIITSDSDIQRVRECLLILDESEIKESVIIDKIKMLGSAISSCIIEKDYSILPTESYSEDRCELAILDKLEIGIINPGFISAASQDFDTSNFELIQKAQDSAGRKLYHLYDVSEIMNSAFLTDNLDRSIAEMFDIIEKFKDIASKDAQIVFYYESRKDIIRTNVYLCIAARMLLTNGYKFLTHKDDTIIYRMFLRDFTGPRFRYVDEYLHHLKRFPDFSIRFSNRTAYMMVRDRVKEHQNQKDYKVTFRALCAEIDLHSRKLLEPFSKTPLEIDLDNVETISIPEIFNLKGSRDVGGVFNEVNAFVTEIDSAVRLVYPYDDFILNCSNLLLFKNQGRTYVSYVISISSKLPFTVKPLADKFPSFSIDLDLPQMLELYDVRILIGLDKVVDRIKASKSGYDVMNFSRDEQSLNGCVLRALNAERVGVIRNNKLTSEDLAMWSEATESFRRSASALVAIFSIKQLQRRGIIGYYGGPIPYVNNKIVITDDIWR